MIEKKILEILDPVVEEIVKLEKRVDALQREPGPAGEPGAPGEDGVSPKVEDVVEAFKADPAMVERLVGEPGAKGDAGRDGVDGKDGADADVAVVAKAIAEGHAEALRGLPGADGADGANGKDADPESVFEALKADLDFVSAIRGEQGLQGERGEKGEPGADGRDGADGKDADPVVVAKALVQDESFLKQIEETPWQPGIHREGKRVSAYTGRSYVAACDTTEEPGDSPKWKRIGTNGWRDTGGYDEKRAYEAGDLYHKDGALFAFDGVTHKLWLARPFTERDFEKQIKGERAANRETLKALIESNKELRAHADGLQAEIEMLKQMIADLAEDLKRVKK